MKTIQTTTGAVCIPFRIEVLMTRADLIDALAWDQRYADMTQPLPRLSAAETARVIRSALYEDGALNLWQWEEVAGVDVEALRAWATEIVDRVYGETFRAAEVYARNSTRKPVLPTADEVRNLTAKEAVDLAARINQETES